MLREDLDENEMGIVLYFRGMKIAFEGLAWSFPTLEQEPLWHELQQFALGNIGRTHDELRFFGTAPRGTRDQLRKWVATLREKTKGIAQHSGAHTWDDLESGIFGQLGQFSGTRYEPDFF